MRGVFSISLKPTQCAKIRRSRYIVNQLRSPKKINLELNLLSKYQEFLLSEKGYLILVTVYPVQYIRLKHGAYQVVRQAFPVSILAACEPPVF